jgi:hypothetical protein
LKIGRKGDGSRSVWSINDEKHAFDELALRIREGKK